MDFSHFWWGHWQDRDQQIINYLIRLESTGEGTFESYGTFFVQENMTEVSGRCDKDQLQKEED